MGIGPPGRVIVLCAIIPTGLAIHQPMIIFKGWQVFYKLCRLALVGPVGSGKSTLLEAIAVAWGVRDIPLRGRSRIAAMGAAALLIGIALAFLARSQVGYWRATVPLFERALAVTEGNFLAHKGLAVGLLRTGDLERAREHFEHALRIKPDWPPAQIGLGDTAMLAGNCAEAVEHYERALAVQPHEANARIALGLCYIKLGRPAEALPHLEFAHQLGNRSEALERALAIARDTR